MLRSWKLGTLFGIGIYIHWTFFLLPAWGFVYTLQSGGVALATQVAAFITVAFGCILLHELGHALMARRFGIPTRDITLYPLGGVARLERMSRRPWEEFWIAIAGPAVNVAIAAVLLGVWVGMSAFISTEDLMNPRGLAGLVPELLVANILLVGFNMIPAFPMDGGRVLRALLVRHLGYLRATQRAVTIGAFLSLVFIAVGLFGSHLPLSSPMLVPVGILVFLMGQQELAVVRHQEAVRRAEPIDVLPADEPIVDVRPISATAGFNGFIWDSRAGLWVQWHNGRPVHGFYPEAD
ncbi:MAG TPA: site-2 protease family protein [Gemmataceae bacterium]|nr:site-2 protease family protein [Gemmataceae bacterium]